MKLKFLGANRQVTGSRHALEAAGQRIMVDCGLFQEREFADRNWSPCPLCVDEIDALFLTHAHIDHSGLIPKLVADGYAGPIYALPPTIELAGIMLLDSAEIQVEDSEYKKRRHQKEGRKPNRPVAPLYTPKDVDAALKLFQPVEYGEAVKLGDGLTATFRDAGHILGSGMLEVAVTEDDRQRRIAFSGDIGQWDKPLMHDPSFIAAADYVVMESTYGDREHNRVDNVGDALAEIAIETITRGGNLVIPTFALERAQEIMYYLSRLVHEKKIPPIPIYVDSPMATDVTEVFRNNRAYLDDEVQALVDSGQPPLRFPGLQFAHSTEESKAINEERKPCVIMSPSGMCTAGRIKHHLRQNIGRPDCTVLFVGFQAHGTLGRQILDGNPHVRIHGSDYKVRAKIAQIGGFSAHADRSGLLRWLGGFEQPPRKVFLVHGEESVALEFAQTVRTTVGCEVHVPEYCEDADLA